MDGGSDVLQEVVITIPKKRNAKRQNGCLRRPYKKLRRETKGKGEKERYIHQNTGFQRTATKHKKAFLSDQCKEIQENNIGKTKDLFKKIRDTKGIFHAKTGTIKERNSIDVTDTEDIKKMVAIIHRRTIQKKKKSS